MIRTLLYLAAIAAANIITAHTVPLALGPFLVTWGTLAAGATFILRDLVQVEYGRRVAYAVIGAGLIVAAVTSAVLGDTLAVVVGSAAAFAVGESFDTEVFSRMRAGVAARVAVSGLVGGTLDTVVFVVVALSPLWSGFVPWDKVPNAILGVVLVKAAMQFVGAGLWALAGPEPEPQAA